MAEGEGYDVASAEARAGRRGLLDTGPHAPARFEYHPPRGVAIDMPGPTHPPVTPGSERGARKGNGVCSGWADEEDYGPRYED